MAINSTAPLLFNEEPGKLVIISSWIKQNAICLAVCTFAGFIIGTVSWILIKNYHP